MSSLRFLDLLSTFVFALVGARVAADKRLDYGGILFIAAIASLAGGTLRNVFLGLLPIWINDLWIIVSVLSAVLLTLVFRRVTHISGSLLLLDTLGLAVATISGAKLANDLRLPWFAVIILGVITAVTGGLLRDILCQLEPTLLHRETIGTSSAIGAIIFVLCVKFSLSIELASLIGGAFVILTRLTSIRFDLHLPKFKD